MDKYDIDCKILEEELKSIWPNWHVVERLGGGAYGNVFRIRTSGLGVPVESALKVIQFSYGEETVSLLPAGPDDLRNEIMIMEDLRGAPNIVTIEDFQFKRDGSTCTLFVRMELLKSFQELLLQHQKDSQIFTQSEVIKIGRDICTALMYCEKKGIIHRDIKPANLFVDAYGNYKVGDFGVSRRMETVHVAMTMTGIGTISYMAPEVFRGNSYNNTVDLYALGLVLYQILNNARIPFLTATGSYDARDIDSANYRRLHGEPLPSLTEIRTRDGRGNVDASLDAVIRKACSPNAKDRFQTAEEFRDALEEIDISQAHDLPFRQDRGTGRAVQNSSLKQILVDKHKSKSVISDNNKEQQKTWSRYVGTGIAIILLLTSMAVFIPKFILKNRTELKQENSQQSGSNGISESVDGGSDHESTHSVAVVDRESKTGMTESEIYSGGETGREERRGTITDSWEEIIAAGEDGTYIDKYTIGDTKELDLGEEGTILMELVGMDVDELADDSGYAHMTWIAKELLNSGYRMHFDYNTYEGWPESDLRDWLRESILPHVPAEVRNGIKTVKKYTNVYGEENAVTEDKIWIPAESEVFPKDYIDDSKGTYYSDAFPDDTSRIRCRPGTSDASWWWLRTDDYWIFVLGVSSEGGFGGDFCTTKGGIVIGFCI